MIEKRIEKRIVLIRTVVISVVISVVIMLIAGGITLIPSCQDDAESLFKKADIMYLDIKTIVTDPAVASFIPEATMQRLSVAEQAYLKASALKDQDNETALKMLANVADEVLKLVEDLQVAEKYQAQVDAIRVVLKIIKNHIQSA